MSFNSKYGKGCGCGSSSDPSSQGSNKTLVSQQGDPSQTCGCTKQQDCTCRKCQSVKQRKFANCSTISAPPTPCCESHDTIVQSGFCLHSTCQVVAKSEEFFIKFQEAETLDFPVSDKVFFFHEGAGLLNIHSKNGNGYYVSLVSGDNEGAIIDPSDCIILSVLPNTSSSVSSATRCVVGNFVAPGEDESTTLFIYNGAGIPLNSRVVFAINGVLGSYTVDAFISSADNVYAYTVTNTGDGHVPGTIGTGGNADECLITVEVIETVNNCDLSTTETIDTLTGCLNSASRAFVPVAQNYVPVGTESGKWDQAKLANVDCCVFTENVLKFSGNSCIGAEDVTVIKDLAGVQCLTDAYSAVLAAGTDLIVRIDDILLRVVLWDSVTRELTLQPAAIDFLPDGDSFLEFPINTQICLGACCDQCINGPQVTDHFTNGGGDPTKASGFSFTVNIPYGTDNIRQFLVGYNTSGVVTVQEITDTYNDDTEPGIGLPRHSDALVLRQKLCNTSLKGCQQEAVLEYNYELAFADVPANLRMHWEFASFVAPSATLADNVTVNPNSFIASQAAAAGYVDGPTWKDLSVTVGTSLGMGNTADSKPYPMIAGLLRDRAKLRHCDCGNAIAWLHIQTQPLTTLGGGTTTMTFSMRRQITKTDTYLIDLPSNDYDLEGFTSGS